MTTALPTLRDLFESGAHFGHLKSRSHPRAKQFSFETRDRVVLIDLRKTLDQLKQAAAFCQSLAKQGGIILFIGTKKQAQDLVQSKAKEADMPYVATKWLAGTLTNFDEIVKNIRKLERLESQLEQSSESSTKREKVKLQQKIAKLHKVLDGVMQLKKLPAALLVVDASTEETAVHEARRLDIPVVAITDTNVDPSGITYPVPANDDSRASIELVLNVLTDAIKAGKKQIKQPKQSDDDKTD